MRRHDERAAGGERVLQRLDYGDRAAVDPTQSGERAMNEQGHARYNTKLPKVSGE